MDSKTASDLVGKIIDWYWSCGVERKEYTIHPSGLYTLRLIRERQHAIAMAANGKPCVAFWGPSQSGKSSLLSHYVDGLDPEGKGKDSALAWGEKIRFSADKNAPENENLLVFNPKNGRNDATGLVTRFYLPASERDVDERCPVTIVPTTRRQILQSLAIGYRKECKSAQRPKRTVADLHHELDDSNGFMRRPNREAFELVCDFCEVCKTLSGTDSRFSCFADDSFLNRIVASRYAESIEVAWALVADMLWDGKDALTSLARDMFRFAESNLSQRKVIRASMAAACVLVDIDSLRKYDGRDRLCLVDKGDELVIDVGEGHPLNQDLFGLLHACIEELQVPLKKNRGQSVL